MLSRSCDFAVIRPFNPSAYFAIILKKIVRILCLRGYASQVEAFS